MTLDDSSDTSCRVTDISVSPISVIMQSPHVTGVGIAPESAWLNAANGWSGRWGAASDGALRWFGRRVVGGELSHVRAPPLKPRLARIARDIDHEQFVFAVEVPDGRSRRSVADGLGTDVTPASVTSNLGRYLDQVRPRMLVGRMGDPRELAATVVFLASDAGGYVTGQTLCIDGGLTIT